MPTAKVPGLPNATVKTQRVEAGVYDVFPEWNEPNVLSPKTAPYVIHRSKYGGGWDLCARDGTDLAHDRSTIQAALECAAARVEHDRQWDRYQKELAEYADKKTHRKKRSEDEGIPFRLMMPPRPDTRTVEMNTGHLRIKVEIQACRLPKASHVPTFQVFVHETPIGHICLVGTHWVINEASQWYAGPNHDWCNLRHSQGSETPEAEAEYFARGAMHATILRYMRTEIERRDAQVAEEQEQIAKRHR